MDTYGEPSEYGWYENSDAVQFAQWAVRYLINNSNYNFNNLLWIQNLGFTIGEKVYLFNNSSLVNFINGLMLQNDIDNDSKQRIAGLYVAFETAYANNTLNSLGQNPLYDYFWDKIEEYISSAAYNGTAKAFRTMHRLYWAISQNANQNKINAWNLFVIDPIRSAVANSNYVNTNLNTMAWKDVLLIWLFELGNYPTIHEGHPTLQFGSGANVINVNGLKNHNNGSVSVGGARQNVKDLITEDGLQNGSRSYFCHFNVQMLSNFISNPNYMEFLLGSYNTNVNWTPFFGNNNYNLSFTIKNITGWESGTRGVNGTFIVPNKPRGQGIHLGGTIAETFVWTELFTP